jgi:hypothetical protein
MQENKTASWQADLDAYLACHEQQDADTARRRRALLEAVHADHKEAAAWQRFLAHEEAAYADLGHGMLRQQPHLSQISLYHLYFWATQLVPRHANHHKEEYLHLWLGFARQQW